MDEASTAEHQATRAIFSRAGKSIARFLISTTCITVKSTTRFGRRCRPRRRDLSFSTLPAATRPERRRRSLAAASEATPASTSRAPRSTSRRESSPGRLPVSLIERDLREALAEWRDPVDIAWLGQSLHHFQPEEKRAVLHSLRRALAPGGTFMLWEPTLLPGEDRHGWLGRLAARRPHGRNRGRRVEGYVRPLLAVRFPGDGVGLARLALEPASKTGAQYSRRRPSSTRCTASTGRARIRVRFGAEAV